MTRNLRCQPRSWSGCILIAICSLLITSSLPAQTPRQSNEASITSTRSYAVAGTNPRSAAQRLERQFGGSPSFRVVVDPRTNRLVIQATAQIHEQIRADLAPTSVENRSTQRFRDTDAVPTREVRGRIRNVGWRKVVSAVESMSPRKLVLKPVGNQLETTLFSRRGDTQIRINPSNGEFVLRGSPELTKAWLDAIRSLDQDRETPSARFVELKTAKRQSVDRAVELLRQARLDAMRNDAARQWTADVVGIRARRNEPVELYHLASDLGEQRNLVDEHPDILRKLMQQWNAIDSQMAEPIVLPRLN